MSRRLLARAALAFLLAVHLQRTSAQSDVLANVASYCQWNFTSSIAATYKKGLSYSAECDAFGYFFSGGSCSVSSTGDPNPGFQSTSIQPFASGMRFTAGGYPAGGYAKSLHVIAPVDPDSPFTRFFLNIWFLVENDSQMAGRQTLFGKSFFNTDPVYMGLFNNSAAGRYDQLCMMRTVPETLDTGTAPLVCSNTTIASGRWHMATLAWLMADVDAFSTINLFLDGGFVGSYHFSTVSMPAWGTNGGNQGRPTSSDSQYSDFSIGATTACFTGDAYFRGLLTKMTFAKTWPSQTMIRSLYNEQWPPLSSSSSSTGVSSSSSSSSSTGVSSSSSSSSTGISSSTAANNSNSSSSSTAVSNSTVINNNSSSSSTGETGSTANVTSSHISSSSSSTGVSSSSSSSSTGSSSSSSSVSSSSSSRSSSTGLSSSSSSSGVRFNSSSTGAGFNTTSTESSSSGPLTLPAIIAIIVGGVLLATVPVTMIFIAAKRAVASEFVTRMKRVNVRPREREMRRLLVRD